MPDSQPPPTPRPDPDVTRQLWWAACLEVLERIVLDGRSAPTQRLALLLFLPLAAAVCITVFVGPMTGVILGAAGAGAGGAVLGRRFQRRDGGPPVLPDRGS